MALILTKDLDGKGNPPPILAILALLALLWWLFS